MTRRLRDTYEWWTDGDLQGCMRLRDTGVRRLRDTYKGWGEAGRFLPGWMRLTNSYEGCGEAERYQLGWVRLRDTYGLGEAEQYHSTNVLTSDMKKTMQKKPCLS